MCFTGSHGQGCTDGGGRGGGGTSSEQRTGREFTQASWLPASWAHRWSLTSQSHVSEPQVQLSLHCTSLLTPRWRQAACGWRDGGRQPPAGGMEASRIQPPRLCPTILEESTGVYLRHKGPLASSAPSHPALSWPPDFPSCATSFLPAFPGAGSGLAPLQNGLIRINPEKAHVLFIPAKVK